MDGFHSDRAKSILSHVRIILVGCNNCSCKIEVIFSPLLVHKLYSKTLGPVLVCGTGTSHSEVSHILECIRILIEFRTFAEKDSCIIRHPC